MLKFCAVVIALAIHAAALLAQAPPPAAGTGVVAGRVLDATGSAIADAVVFLRSATATPGAMRPSGPGQPVPVPTSGSPLSSVTVPPMMPGRQIVMVR